MDVTVAPEAARLDGDKTCDTVIVGSGIAGLSTAYELAIKGQRVIVVDRGPIAGPGGATPTKPVGLVYIACSTPWGDHCEEHRFTGNRIETIRASAEAALACVIDQLSLRDGSTHR